jgi:Uri superfamily endonuclease
VNRTAGDGRPTGRPSSYPIYDFGVTGEGGAYLLRIHVARPLAVVFGRYRGGTPVAVPAGDCIYVGSALGERGKGALRHRLLRHSARSSGKQPHILFAALSEHFARWSTAPGSSASAPQKTLRWHVDYLLDEEATQISAVYILRCLWRLEEAIAALLLQDPSVFVIAPGLGASDARSESHLLGVRADTAWWDTLTERLDALVLPADQAL